MAGLLSKHTGRWAQRPLVAIVRTPKGKPRAPCAASATDGTSKGMLVGREKKRELRQNLPQQNSAGSKSCPFTCFFTVQRITALLMAYRIQGTRGSYTMETNVPLPVETWKYVALRGLREIKHDQCLHSKRGACIFLT